MWLRTPETDDGDRLAAELAAVEAAIKGGATQLHLVKSGLRVIR